MTKLLGAYWLRSVQLYSSTINDFAKINKMAESKMAESRHLNTKEIAPEKHLKQKD